MTPSKALRILKLDTSATKDEIKAAYRQLAMVHHPDRGGDQDTFQEISKAYKRLAFICEECGGTGVVRVKTGGVVKKTPCKTCWSAIT